MQFYIIHPDPETNARLLPVYALKSVNLREGWQILSDIGHRFGVHWEGQNKPYNPYHPLTRTFSHAGSFLGFVNHYAYCLGEYTGRGIGKPTVWHVGMYAYMAVDADLRRALPADEYAETRHYLTTRKADKLTPEELEALGTA